MKGFVSTMDRIAIAAAAVAAVLLAAAALLITWMVIWRSMGNSAWWEIEAAVYLMVMSLFLASPYTLKTNGHVGVDLLAHYLPPGKARRLQIAVAWVGLATCIYLAWATGVFTLEAFERGDRTESTWAPLKWPLYLAMPVGFVLTALQYVAEIYRPVPGAAPESAA